MGFVFLSMASDRSPTDGGDNLTNDRALWEANFWFAIPNVDRIGVDFVQLVFFMGYGLTF